MPKRRQSCFNTVADRFCQRKGVRQCHRVETTEPGAAPNTRCDKQRRAKQYVLKWIRYLAALTIFFAADASGKWNWDVRSSRVTTTGGRSLPILSSPAFRRGYTKTLSHSSTSQLSFTSKSAPASLRSNSSASWPKVEEWELGGCMIRTIALPLLRT
eukprot:1336622-Rhodomonas_salina.1